MQVSVCKTKAYQKEEIKSVLWRHFTLLGGVSAWIQPGMRVLIKPNLLMPQGQETAVTTHPYFVEALAQIIAEAGAQAVIADSGGGPYTASLQQHLYRATGMQEAAQQSGAQLGTKIMPPCTVPCPEGKLVKQFSFIREYAECDFLISLAKCKNHMLTGFTGAVKNCFGLVPGLAKSEYHFRFPDKNDFVEMILDLCLTAKPGLAIMDAVYGMEGDGPSGGKKKHLGFSAMSENPFALDFLVSQMLGLPVENCLTVAASQKRGLIPSTVAALEVVGDDWQDLCCHDWQAAQSRDAVAVGRLPAFLRIPLAHMLTSRVQVEKKKCIGCGKCVSICPQQTIVLQNGKAQIDSRQCIRCYCCHEICPKQAIRLKRAFLYRF